jgi:succinyl-CoA synthetase beta subunit
MNLHEYQAKQLFAQYGMPVSFGIAVKSASEVAEALAQFKSDKIVVKAQVHAGGRGKAGGVKIVDKSQVAALVEQWIGTKLVTFQTTEEGQPITAVFLEEPCQIAHELYLSVVLDRSTRQFVMMASTEGGVDIEEVAEKTPEKIFKVALSVVTKALPYQARQLAFKLGLKGQAIKQVVGLMQGLTNLCFEQDLSLVEINPLVITENGDLLCLDGKINIDDNAMYRHPDLEEMRDIQQEDEREAHAQKWELNYIALDGEIGCMVNGAGLAMATMDLIQLHGGTPANFLDVGGGATQERVREAFKIILSDTNVKAILVNIFGGIVRCDLIAEGILAAVEEVNVQVPVVVRLEGNNSEKAGEMLKDCTFNIQAAPSLTEAAQMVVKSLDEGAAA